MHGQKLTASQKHLFFSGCFERGFGTVEHLGFTLPNHTLSSKSKTLPDGSDEDDLSALFSVVPRCPRGSAVSQPFCRFPLRLLTRQFRTSVCHNQGGQSQRSVALNKPYNGSQGLEARKIRPSERNPKP